VGPYTILKVLGEGGMGTVYLAEQLEPIRRTVALKLIKLGQDSKEVLARFEQEFQALSLMNHPAIAKVLDAGATEDGRPYFVMEYVDGTRISDYADEHRLSLVERLHLFMEVCAGLQHAHQKGIIHRDIKPSNILVTVEQGKAIPKLIDFGLALATEQKLTEQTLFTKQGAWIGTPEYMSPEQAGSGVDVDTRADIYSLGVLLYELLTGRQPFETWLLREAGIAELQRTIQEVEPPRPSSKVSTIGDESSYNAELRRTDPATLVKRLRGDLDWIVMKALEKDRTRRYASASEFAADIARHLNHEPALAGPPSWVYRTGKFLRRYRLQVGAAIAVLAALVSGLVLAWQQYRRAEANVVLAKQREQDAKREKAAAEASAKAAKASEVEALSARARMSVALEQANRERERTAESVQMFNFLAVVQRLRELRRVEAALYPAWPEQTAAIRMWLSEHRRIGLQMRDARNTLVGLERKLSEHQPKYEGRLKNIAERYKRIRSAYPGTYLNNVISLFSNIREKQEVEAVQQLEELRRDQFIHDALRGLITDFDSSTRTLLPRMRARLLWARNIQRNSIDAFSDAWKEAAQAIQADERFAGKPLRPQIGLVPLGTDPSSGFQEFVQLASQAPNTLLPRRATDGHLEIDTTSGIVFVLLPGGTFRLGAQSQNRTAPRYDPAARANERPVTTAYLDPFFIAKCEVTQAQWLRLAQDNPSMHAPGIKTSLTRATLMHPVENISWRTTQSILHQTGLALPTEAQWEYAARAGVDTPWPTGADASSLRGHANLAEDTFGPENGDGFATTAPVGSFAPNRFGLYDVAGNVWEWCRESESSYGSLHRGDGLGVVTGSNAIIRGGSWNLSTQQARCAHRAHHGRGKSSDTIGVRPIRQVR